MKVKKPNGEILELSVAEYIELQNLEPKLETTDESMMPEKVEPELISKVEEQPEMVDNKDIIDAEIREPEESAHCPKCNVYRDTFLEIHKLFGYRKMNGKDFPQSYCRKCRKENVVKESVNEVVVVHKTGIVKPEYKNRWTREEDNLLLSNLSKLAEDVVSLFPGRTSASVRVRQSNFRKKLNISMKRKFWTEEEDAVLRTGHHKNTIQEMVKMFEDRKIDSIRARANRLGVKLIVSESVKSNSKKFIILNTRVTQLMKQYGWNRDKAWNYANNEMMGIKNQIPEDEEDVGFNLIPLNVRATDIFLSMLQNSFKLGQSFGYNNSDWIPVSDDEWTFDKWNKLMYSTLTNQRYILQKLKLKGKIVVDKNGSTSVLRFEGE